MPDEEVLQPEPVDDGGASDAASPTNSDDVEEIDEMPEDVA